MSYIQIDDIYPSTNYTYWLKGIHEVIIKNYFHWYFNDEKIQIYIILFEIMILGGNIK